MHSYTQLNQEVETLCVVGLYMLVQLFMHRSVPFTTDVDAMGSFGLCSVML